MASVKGVKVSDMLSMTDIAPEVNTITFKDKDGYGLPMPLSYVLEKEALLVYQIDEQKLSEGEDVYKRQEALQDCHGCRFASKS